MTSPPLPAGEALYREAPCGLLLAASDGRLLCVNEILCRWLQTPREELVGRVRLQDLLTMGGRIFYQTHLQPLLRIQASVAEVKLEMRRRDGDTIPVLMNIAERPHDGGTLLHAAVFLAEDRHKYERELLLQRRRAEELAAQHGRDQQEIAAARAAAEDRAPFAEQLVGMVSHDIRNPLSVIHMTTVLLERGVDEAQQRAAVQRRFRHRPRARRRRRGTLGSRGGHRVHPPLALQLIRAPGRVRSPGHAPAARRCGCGAASRLRRSPDEGGRRSSRRNKPGSGSAPARSSPARRRPARPRHPPVFLLAPSARLSSDVRGGRLIRMACRPCRRWMRSPIP